jgi:uncharacterized protein
LENLIIDIEQIEEPRQLEERSLSKAFLKEVLADAPAYEPAEQAELSVHLTRVGDTDVFLEGSTTMHLKSECRRCLTEVRSEFPVVFSMNLFARKKPEPAPTARRGRKGEKPKEAEVELIDETEMDEDFFDGDEIDLAPILREQLLLGLPPIEPLCKDDCKGLCTTCGEDLNVKDCGHSQKPIDPRWTGLKDLKL